jgi:hypothetical protein
MRLFLCLMCGLLFVAVALSTGSAEKTTLEAGFAEVDITPKVDLKGKPVYLAGFGQNRTATGVADKLSARAVVFGQGKGKIAIASVDLVGLFYESSERIRKELTGFAHVVISSTHNHEGPDTMGMWGPNPLMTGVDKTYLTSVEKAVVKAIQDADKSRRAVDITIGQTKAPELLHDSRKPILKHDDLMTLHCRAGEKSVGIVVQWNCHPETLDSKNRLISADYVGYTVKHLSEKYKCPIVYLTGTVGGLMTSLRVPIQDEKGKNLADGTYEKTARYGYLLGKAAEKAIENGKMFKATPIEGRAKTVYVPLANQLFVGATKLGLFDRQAYEWTGAAKDAKPAKELNFGGKYAAKSEVGYLRMGELSIACIPGEIYPELVLDKVAEKAEAEADFPDAPIEPAIYKQMPGPHRMLIGLANDELGYILPKRQWDAAAPYCYGQKKAPYGEVNSPGPDTAKVLCEAFRDVVAGK